MWNSQTCRAQRFLPALLHYILPHHWSLNMCSPVSFCQLLILMVNLSIHFFFIWSCFMSHLSNFAQSHKSFLCFAFQVFSYFRLYTEVYDPFELVQYDTINSFFFFFFFCIESVGWHTCWKAYFLWFGILFWYSRPE